VPGATSGAAPVATGGSSADQGGAGRWGRRWVIDVVVGVLLVVVTFGLHDAAPVSHSGGDSAWNLYVAWSVVTEGDVDLNEWRPVAEVFPHNWYETHEGNVLSTFPYGTGLVSAPIVGAIGAKEAVLGRSVRDTLLGGIPQAELENTVASVWVALTTGALFAVLRLRRHGIGVAVALSATFAVGSSAFSTASRALWMHGPTMFLLVAALLLLQLVVRATAGGARPGPAVVLQGAGIGAAFALAFTVRPTVVVPAALFLLALVVRSRAATVAALAAAAPIIGVFLAVNLDLYVAWLPAYYDPTRLEGSSTWLVGLVGNLLSPGRGLLVWTPWVAFAAMGAVVGVRRRDLVALVCAVTVVAYWAVVSRHQPWFAGWTLGPRLLVDVLPFLAVLTADAVAVLVAQARHRRPVGVAGLAALSAACLVAVALNTRAAVRPSVITWNFEPVPVEDDQGRLWDWSDPPFLR
jgi:hypothetical protein